MECIFESTGLTSLDLDQEPQAALKNKMGNFVEAYLQKSYAWALGKGNEPVNIARRSRQIGMKLQTKTTTASPPLLNIPPNKYRSITLGLTLEASEDDGASLIGGASLSL